MKQTNSEASSLKGALPAADKLFADRRFESRSQIYWVPIPHRPPKRLTFNSFRGTGQGLCRAREGKFSGRPSLQISKLRVVVGDKFGSLYTATHNRSAKIKLQPLWRSMGYVATYPSGFANSGTTLSPLLSVVPSRKSPEKVWTSERCQQSRRTRLGN